METHGRSSKSRKEAASSSSKSRRRRKFDNSESDLYTGSGDGDSFDSFPVRSSGRRKERSSRKKSSRRKDSDDESYEREEHDHKKKGSSRNITEEQIAEYLAKKQKKASQVAKRIKSKIVLGYTNDSNSFGNSNLNEIFVWRKKIERDVSHRPSLDVFSAKAQKQSQTSGDSKPTWVNHRVKYPRCKPHKQFLGRYYHRDYGPVKFVSEICISKECGSVSSIILCFALVNEWSRSGRKLNLKHKCANWDYNEAFETMLRVIDDTTFEENDKSMCLLLAQIDRKGSDFLLGLLMSGFKRAEGMNPAKEKLFLQGYNVLSAIVSNVCVIVVTRNCKDNKVLTLSHFVVMSDRRFKAAILVFPKSSEYFVAYVLLNKMEREDHLIAALALLVKDNSGCINNGELQQPCKKFGHICDEIIKEVCLGVFDIIGTSNEQRLYSSLIGQLKKHYGDMCFSILLQERLNSTLSFNIYTAMLPKEFYIGSSFGAREVMVLKNDLLWNKVLTGEILIKNFSVHNFSSEAFEVSCEMINYSSQLRISPGAMTDNCSFKEPGMENLCELIIDNPYNLIGQHCSMFLWRISASVKPDFKLLFRAAKNFKTTGNLLYNVLYAVFGITMVTKSSFNKARKIIMVMSTAVHEVVCQLQDRDSLLALLKKNLHKAQDRMKLFYDKNHTERSFEVGQWVYLKLQPYKQQTVEKRTFHKLSPRYYGPFQILQKIRSVAYKLKLPSSSRIHPVFRVSLLKAKIGNFTVISAHLPPNVDPANPRWYLARVLNRGVFKKGNGPVTKWLNQWLGTLVEEATWEEAEDIQHRNPDFQA